MPMLSRAAGWQWFPAPESRLQQPWETWSQRPALAVVLMALRMELELALVWRL